MDAFIGITSSTLATFILHPIDVIKTRYQISRLKKPTTVQYTITSIYKNGFKSFYKGLGPNLGTYPIFWSVYFQTNSIQFEPTDNTFTNKFLKAQISACIASTISNPLFVFKTRAQTNNSGIKYSKLASNMIKNEGILGFYKGLGSTLLNNTKLGIQMPLYDYLHKNNELTLNNSLLSSLISKGICTTLFYPFDLVRVNQRNEQTKLSIANGFKNAYKNGGIIGLYRGVLLYNLISTPNFVLMMWFKDIIEKRAGQFLYLINQ